MFIHSLTLLALAGIAFSTPRVRPRQWLNTTCTPLPEGFGPVPSPDTAEAFLADKDFTSAALGAETPSGYASSFTNLDAIVTGASSLGFTTLRSYNPGICASACDQLFGCLAFDIFFERQPTYEPADTCMNPPSTTMIKCSFWGVPVSPATATDKKQSLKNFHVVRAGSNGYTSTSAKPSISGYTPTSYGLAAILAPLDCHGKNTLIGIQTFNNTRNDPMECAQACDAHNAYWAGHKDSGVPMCEYFNSYVLAADEKYYAEQCALYSAAWPARYAQNTGQWQGSVWVGVSWSFGYKRQGSKEACIP